MVPSIRSLGRSGESATRRPPNPQPMSAIVMGFRSGAGSSGLVLVVLTLLLPLLLLLVGGAGDI